MTTIALVSLLAMLVACVSSREITRFEDNGIIFSPDDADATPAVLTDKPSEEKKIRKQVEALNKMKCKSIREKVYTKDYIPESENAYLEADTFDIFPEVLSVRKCNPNCSYCRTDGLIYRDVPWRKGFTDVFTCQAIKPNMKKKYTIRVTNRHTGEKKYLHIKLVNEKCKCKRKPINL